MSQPTEPSRWERFLPLSGVAFTALTVAGAAAFPTPPGGDVSPASDPHWLSQHQQAIIDQSYVRALAAITFIALAVAVAAAIRRALPAPSSLPAAALVGGAFTGGLLLLSQAVSLAAALYVRSNADENATRALASVQEAFLDLSSLPAVLLFAAAGLAAWRTGLLPRWLTVLTVLGVPFALLDAASYDGGPFESVGFVGLVFFLAWALLAGVHLYLSPGLALPTATHREGQINA